MIHPLLDMAKKGRWSEVFTELARCESGRSEGMPRYVDCLPYPRRFGFLHFAAHQGRAEVLRRLLKEFQADPDLMTLDGQTALDLAQASKSQACIQVLEQPSR